MFSFWGGRKSVVLGAAFVPFLTNVKQSVQQKVCTGHEQPFQKKKEKKILFQGQNSLMGIKLLLLLLSASQSCMSRVCSKDLPKLKALSSLEAYPYGNGHFQLQQIFIYTYIYFFFPIPSLCI